jgi:hypothetical protein
MLLKEFANKKMQELISEKCKNVKVGSMTECDLKKGGSISYLLFNPVNVNENVTVSDTWSNTEDHKGVQVRITYVKPRCQKQTSKYVYAKIV